MSILTDSLNVPGIELGTICDIIVINCRHPFDEYSMKKLIGRIQVLEISISELADYLSDQILEMVKDEADGHIPFDSTFNREHGRVEYTKQAVEFFKFYINNSNVLEILVADKLRI